MTEQDAVQLCRRGDPAGLEALVAVHQARAIRLAALITRDQQWAEDVVADAFLQAYRRIETFDTARRFGPWFHRIVTNTALRAVQSRRRELPFETAGIEDALDVDDPAAHDAVANVERLDDREAIRAALRDLPPGQRAAIVLRYYADLDEAAIADRLAIPRGTVKSRLFNGLSRLRTRLAASRPA